MNRTVHMLEKVGIITFHRSINYGSVLQAWSLVQAIIEEGALPEIIDYIPYRYNELYSLFEMPSSTAAIKKDLCNFLLFPYIVRRNRGFSHFWKEHLPLSDKTFHAGSDIISYIESKDVMICGSDQIWNPAAKDFDKTYLLPYCVSTRKAAYAVSLGNVNVEDVEESKRVLFQYIKDYSHVSLRENSGAVKLHQLVGDDIPVDVVLDPTLLLSSSSFNKITSERIIYKPYIFVYSVWQNKEALDAAIILGKKTGLPIYMLISGNISPNYIRRKKQIKLAPGDAGPSGFLSMVKHADYVVTDSFHGTVFSLIFEKDFFSINTHRKDGHYKNDERIMNILKQLNLTGRYISLEKINDFFEMDSIQYTEVIKKRMYLAEKSKQYLRKTLFDE